MITRNRRCGCGARLSWPTVTSCDSCKLRGRWERLHQAEDDRQRRERDRQVVDQLAADRADLVRRIDALLSRDATRTAPLAPARR